MCVRVFECVRVFVFVRVGVVCLCVCVCVCMKGLTELPAVVGSVMQTVLPHLVRGYDL